MGSPKSHRTITSKFSEITGCAVLAIDYRLLPEYKHMDCVADCRAAYHWILGNGPDGPAEITQLFIGGDSAGGNLTLSLVAWVRDNDLRAPEAVVVLSPLTDTTFSGASISDNEGTDVMLKPVMRALNKMPKFVKSWWVVWAHRVRPASPVASPLLGDLSGLLSVLEPAGDVYGGEVYYNAEINPWFHLTLDLQVVEPTFQSRDTAIVAGLRGKIDF